MSDANRTLYTAYPARSPDRRKRAGSRSPRWAGPTSDVTRFRGLAAAAIAGGAAAVAVALIVPPSGGHLSPGPLSRPHARAGVACSSCHGARSGEQSDPVRACTGCHGVHASTRPGHRAAIGTGAMTCATCHPIHAGDQGVTFSPTEAPVRFAPGIERIVPADAFAAPLVYRPAAPTTVAITTVASCIGCHDAASASDPIARCLLGGQASLGRERPIVCFDEHPVSLAHSATAARLATLEPVCAAQHTAGRAAAWEAAREVAAAVPVLPHPTRGGGPWLWSVTGLVVAALVLGGVRGAFAIAERKRRKTIEAVPEALLKPAVRVRLPQIDTTTCLGCYACVDACPYDVLEVDRYVAVVVRPDACCGLTLCEQRCPNGSLQITDGEPIGDRPRLGDGLDSLDVPGLWLAGDVTGLPLIKNAIHQGALAAARIADSLKHDRKREERRGPAGNVLDLIIVGAGPAGISAALAAKERGLSFEVVEQGSVASSIRSFPRGKLVFDQPLELPSVGKLWLEESTKEELLSHWLRIVRKERLPIRENTRMTAARRGDDGIFCVMTAPADGGAPVERRARRVLLAVGQRGTPRRLPFELAPEAEARVHYHLADARTFEGKCVVVVGLGDVAMETAVALSRQRGTFVTVIYRGETFSRGKARNIAEVRREADAGRIDLRFRTEIVGVGERDARLTGPDGEASLACDAVFVMIGSIPPWDLLRAAGVGTVSTPSAPSRVAGTEPPA